jgi:hypothetical protein
MISRLSLTFVAVLCVLAAGLPNVAPPGNDKLQEQKPSPRRVRTATGTAKPANAAEKNAEGPMPSKLDVLMKSLADPNTPVSGTQASELRRMKQFASLSHDEQSMAIPELLSLLSNNTELSARGDRPSSAVWRVHHRATLALVTIARVHLGQFPMRERDKTMTPAERDEDRRAAETLRKRWQAWWAEAKPLDEPGRTKLSRRLRASYYDVTKEDVFWANIDFARAQKDPTPLPQLAQWLVGPKAEQQATVTRIIPIYAELCKAADAPPEALLPLLEYIKTNNPEGTAPQAHNIGSNWWRNRNAANYLRQLTGTGGNPWENKRVEIGEGDNKRAFTVRRVSDKAIAAWEKTIRERIEAAKPPSDKSPSGDEPIAPKPQADPDSD